MSFPAHLRRKELLGWLRESVRHHDLTATEIANVSGVYDGVKHASDRCFDDLKALEQKRLVWRAGRPAEWTPTS